MREAVLLKLCLLAVSDCGARGWRNNRGMFLSLDAKRKQHAGLQAAGASDIIGITRDGRFLAIEVKSDKGRVSDEQQRFIDMVNKAGGLAFVARSVADVKYHLSSHAKNT